MARAILGDHRWIYDCGFKMSISKSCTIFMEEEHRELYEDNLKRVSEYKKKITVETESH